jgi:putative selenate reductase
MIMSDKMTPVPFGSLMEWILEEKKSKGTVFGIHKPYKSEVDQVWHIFGGKLETPFGPAAGPHTQLAQNIIAAYYAGGRFFELKTVQILDGEELPVSKPCIKADDEGYNVEWSTELYVPQAFEEYVKAWIAIHVIAKEFGLGSSDGFQFNMSVGYDLEGIKSQKIDTFIEGLKDASRTPVFEECLDWLSDHLNRFDHVALEDIQAIPAAICNSVTLSTLHGCPPQEIERIAGYLLTEKHLNTFVKCNPTLLGYEYARSTLDRMGYDYVSFGEFHFKDDLQYEDAVPMLKRLMTLAGDLGLGFGVKITNTFPVDICSDELPGTEMYMSGKALFPLSMSVAERLSKDFEGRLRISYSGGADYFNINKVVEAGIFPVTMATTLLKPGGYRRMEQIAELLTSATAREFTGIDTEAASKLVKESVTSPYHVKAVKILPSRKMNKPVPLIDCFTAPCQQGCPINQDTTAYISLVEEGKYKEAFGVILEKNPLPFITGTICSHRCMSRCTRNFYESPVNIRRIKLEAAQGGFDEFMKNFRKSEVTGNGKAAIIGGGPAGLAAAYFLAKQGIDATIFEKNKELGGLVRTVIPGFRISNSAISNDISLIRSMGVRIETKKEIKFLKEIREDYDDIILAVGASEPGILQIGLESAWNAIDFLESFKKKDGDLDIGRSVAVIGGGNTAMDAARAAKRVKGVDKVSLIYRRTKRYMPADEEEISLALEDGIIINELLSPVEMKSGHLVCRKMKLKGMDSTNRMGFEGTNEFVDIEADTVIAAIGEHVPKAFYLNNGIKLNDKGFAAVDPDTLESSVKGVYIIGDGLNGPSTVVETIRDAMKAAEGISKKTAAANYSIRISDDVTYRRKGVLMNEDKTQSDCSRCLYCSSVCENCVDVCPNRANVSVKVPGMDSSQIIHLDYACNECGNCRTFCPYESAPYLDKLTLFANETDFNNSKNNGFVLTSPESKGCLVRIENEVFEYSAGGKSERMSDDICKLITAVVDDYTYL